MSQSGLAKWIKWAKYAGKVINNGFWALTGYEANNIFSSGDENTALVKYVDALAVERNGIHMFIKNGIKGATENISIHLLIILVAIFVMLLLSVGAKIYACIKKHAVKQFKEDLESVSEYLYIVNFHFFQILCDNSNTCHVSWKDFYSW